MRVRWAECDPQGVVFNAQYLSYLDTSLTELWRVIYDGGYVAMLADGADMVVAEATQRFLAPARFDDEIDIEATPTRIGNTAVTTAMRIVRGDEVLLEAELRHVFINREDGRKMRIPDRVREGLAPYASAGAVAGAGAGEA